MIIEVSGIPGVGKSSVIEKLIEENESSNVIFDVKEYILKNCFFTFKNVFFYDLILFLSFFLLKWKDVIVIYYSCIFIIKDDNSIFNKFNILRNIIKKMIIHRYAISKDKIFFIDEGITHILFNLFVGNTKKYSEDVIISFLLRLPSPDKILIIDAPDDIIKKRIKDRGESGHNRIDFTKVDRFENFMNQSRKVIEIIKENSNPIIFLNTNNDFDLKEIKIKLGIENV
jgi:broad-specificity NMP kinase